MERQVQIQSSATENGSAFRDCFVCTRRSAGPLSAPMRVTHECMSAHISVPSRSKEGRGDEVEGRRGGEGKKKR